MQREAKPSYLFERTMTFFPCPYLDSSVELTDEREHHITLRHPDLLPRYRQCIPDVLMLPDRVTRSPRIRTARLFSRWFDSLRGVSTLSLLSLASPRQRKVIGLSLRTWLENLQEGKTLNGNESDFPV